MQGIYIDFRRPKSKKELREFVKYAYERKVGPYAHKDGTVSEHATVTNGLNDLARITIEATSMFGNEYGGSLADMPETTKVTFVGPDPYTKRNFYGNIEFKAGKGWKVT